MVLKDAKRRCCHLAGYSIDSCLPVEMCDHRWFSKALFVKICRVFAIIIVIIIIWYYRSWVLKSKVKITEISKQSWSGHSSSLGKLLWSRIELNRWMMTDVCWKRKLGFCHLKQPRSYGPAQQKVRCRFIQRTECLFRDRLEGATWLYQLSYLADFRSAACSVAALPKWVTALT